MLKSKFLRSHLLCSLSVCGNTVCIHCILYAYQNSIFVKCTLIKYATPSKIAEWQLTTLRYVIKLDSQQIVHNWFFSIHFVNIVEKNTFIWYCICILETKCHPFVHHTVLFCAYNWNLPNSKYSQKYEFVWLKCYQRTLIQ